MQMAELPETGKKYNASAALCCASVLQGKHPCWIMLPVQGHRGMLTPLSTLNTFSERAHQPWTPPTACRV